MNREKLAQRYHQYKAQGLIPETLSLEQYLANAERLQEIDKELAEIGKREQEILKSLDELRALQKRRRALESEKDGIIG